MYAFPPLFLQVNAIIEEASKGSKFYEHKANAQKRIDIKKDSMKNRMRILSNEEIESANRSADKYVQEIKDTETDTSKVIVHVDMVSTYQTIPMTKIPSKVFVFETLFI